MHWLITAFGGGDQMPITYAGLVGRAASVRRTRALALRSGVSAPSAPHKEMGIKTNEHVAQSLSPS